MAGRRALWTPGLLFFTDERGPEVHTVGPAQMPSRGRGSQCGGAPSRGGGSTATVTFTGDTVGQQLVAHEARADDLLPRVSALLLAGPAAWNRGESEQMGAGSRTHTTHLLGFQFRLEWARANSLGVHNIQRWAPHFGAHPLLPSTPPFPQETSPAPALDNLGAAASGPSPGPTKQQQAGPPPQVEVALGGAGRRSQGCWRPAQTRRGPSREGGQAPQRPHGPPQLTWLPECPGTPSPTTLPAGS